MARNKVDIQVESAAADREQTPIMAAVSTSSEGDPAKGWMPGVRPNMMRRGWRPLQT